MARPAGERPGYPALIAHHDQAAEIARRAAAHVIVADLDRPELHEPDRHHLRSVLRVRSDEDVSITDGYGGWRLCRLTSAGVLTPTAEIVRQARPAPMVTIGFAPIKGERPGWAVQKLIELGVDRIVLLTSARGVVRWQGERAERHLDRLRAVALQAVKQSRRVWLPEIAGFEGAESLAACPGVAMATPGGSPPSLDHPTVLVGPEGGWSPSEEASARATIDLGPGVLRTESAAVAAGVLLTALRAGLVRAR
jgi:16S rRNA (uracil1498-N3)-methyltransferase